MRLDHITESVEIDRLLETADPETKNILVDDSRPPTYLLNDSVWSLMKVNDKTGNRFLAFEVSTLLSDDNSELEPPDPIPNSAVKRFSADGSVGFPHVRVGHRQALFRTPGSNEPGVFLWANG